MSRSFPVPPGRLAAALLPLVLAAGAVFLWVGLADLPFAPSRRRIGPDAWPKLVLALLLAGCAWRFAEAVFLNRADAGEPREGGAGSRATAARAWATVLVLLLYVALLPFLGFPVASGLLMAAVMALAGLRRWRLLVTTAVLASLGFFLVFQKLAYLPLPLGSGPFRDLTLGLAAAFGVR